MRPEPEREFPTPFEGAEPSSRVHGEDGTSCCSYESAGGVVVRPRGEVLVLVRPKRLGPNERPEVRLPKGHVEPGESPKEAALREVHEESGIAHLEVLADLGLQRVEFTWKRTHYVRNETYFLMTVPPDAQYGKPEVQFERRWLAWAEAMKQLTYAAEKEWVRRASIAWSETTVCLRSIHRADQPRSPDVEGDCHQ